MKRLIIFITTLLLTTITVSAQQISREVAAQKATAFANKANPQVKQLLTLAYKADKPATALAPKDDAYFYVFNKGFNQGFVIVSGDGRTPNDILGYDGESKISALSDEEDECLALLRKVPPSIRDNIIGIIRYSAKGTQR